MLKNIFSGVIQFLQEIKTRVPRSIHLLPLSYVLVLSCDRKRIIRGVDGVERSAIFGASCSVYLLMIVFFFFCNIIQRKIPKVSNYILKYHISLHEKASVF